MTFEPSHTFKAKKNIASWMVAKPLIDFKFRPPGSDHFKGPPLRKISKLGNKMLEASFKEGLRRL